MTGKQWGKNKGINNKIKAKCINKGIKGWKIFDQSQENRKMSLVIFFSFQSKVPSLDSLASNFQHYALFVDSTNALKHLLLYSQTWWQPRRRDQWIREAPPSQWSEPRRGLTKWTRNYVTIGMTMRQYRVLGSHRMLPVKMGSGFNKSERGQWNDSDLHQDRPPFLTFWSDSAYDLCNSGILDRIEPKGLKMH